MELDPCALGLLQGAGRRTEGSVLFVREEGSLVAGVVLRPAKCHRGTPFQEIQGFEFGAASAVVDLLALPVGSAPTGIF